MLKIKRLCAHVFQTLLLVGAVCLCILLGHDPWAATLMPFVWGLNILLILGGIGYALYRSRRTALRMIIVAIGVSLTVLAGPSMAQMEQPPQAFLTLSLSLLVLTYSGCCNKILQAGGLNNRYLFSQSLGG